MESKKILYKTNELLAILNNGTKVTMKSIVYNNEIIRKKNLLYLSFGIVKFNIIKRL